MYTKRQFNIKEESSKCLLNIREERGLILSMFKYVGTIVLRSLVDFILGFALKNYFMFIGWFKFEIVLKHSFETKRLHDRN